MTKDFSKSLLSRLLKEAAHFLRDPRLLNQLTSNATRLLGSNQKRFAEIKQDFERSIRAVSAYKNGVYRKMPLRSILTIIASLVYFVNPFDLVPDFLMGVGYLDDVALVAYCFRMIRRDLRDFEDWEKTQQKKAPDHGSFMNESET